MIRFLLNPLAPKPTPDDQALIDQLRNVPLPEVTPEMHERAMARFRASIEGAAYDGFAEEVTAYREAAAEHGLRAEYVGVWPAVPTPPPAPRPREPRLAGGIDGSGLKRRATVEEDLACVDRLDLSPLRKQWLKAEIRCGQNLWDLLAQDDWDDLPTPGVARYDERDDETGGRKRYADGLGDPA